MIVNAQRWMCALQAVQLQYRETPFKLAGNASASLRNLPSTEHSKIPSAAHAFCIAVVTARHQTSFMNISIQYLVFFHQFIRIPISPVCRGRSHLPPTENSKLQSLSVYFYLYFVKISSQLQLVSTVVESYVSEKVLAVMASVMH